MHALPSPAEERDTLGTLDAYFGGKKVYYKLQSGQIVSLGVLGAGLTTLPEGLTRFTSLEHLDLWGNQIILLPPLTGRLLSLKSLDLCYNRLCEFPAEVIVLKDLEELNLGFNYCPEVTPDIRHLRNLQKLDLEGNLLRDLPEEFCNLTLLANLNLGGNPLTHLPRHFGKLRALRRLDLRRTRLKAFPPSFGELKALEELELAALPRGGISSLLDLSALRKLSLDVDEDDDDWGRHGLDEEEIPQSVRERDEMEGEILDRLEERGIEVEYTGAGEGEGDLDPQLPFAHSPPSRAELTRARLMREREAIPPSQKHLDDFFYQK